MRSMILLLLLACGGAPAPEATDLPTTLTAADVAKAVTEPISAGPRVSGTLEPADRAVIRAEANGSVLTVKAEIGQTVAEGEVLATIESSALRQALASAQAAEASAEADLANATRELERVTRLFEAGALASRDKENAESGLKAAKARLEAAQAQRAAASEQLSGATVKAPFAGVVSARSVSQGDVVAMGSALFTVINPGTLRLEGAVPADTAGQVQPGLTVRFDVQGFGGQTFDGSVERVSPAVDTTTRQVPVIVTLPNPDGKLLAGLFAEGHVAVNLHDGLVVPSGALEADRVMRVSGGKVEEVTVTVGVRDEASERVEILSGLNPGDTVLVGAARDLQPGAAVNLPAGAEG